MIHNINSKPNIILINVDDLGWTDLGCMGSTFYETPNIDKLASNGCIFTRAYASAPNCAPSRANLLTGLQPSRHGVYTVGDSERGESLLRKLIPVQNKPYVDYDIPTIGHAFQDIGYYTGVIGKWHISKDPLKHGFNENFAGCHMGMPKTYFSPYNIPTLKDGEDGEYLPERLANEVVNFIGRNKENPFFLYYPTYLVHTPLEAKDETVEKYKKKRDLNNRHKNPVYAAMVESLDDVVGKVMESLRVNNLLDNTLVLFTSDNGGIRSISRQTPLKAGKGALYEGGIRVPLIAHWPEKIKAGSTSQSMISNLDFFPTLLNLCGGNATELKLDGEDKRESLLGEESNTKQEATLWHFPVYLGPYEPQMDEGRDPLFRTRPCSMIMQGDWKLHYFYEDGVYELYNIKEDIGERFNVVEKEKETFKALKIKLQQLLDYYQMPLPTELNPEFDEKENQKRIHEIICEETPEHQTEEDWYRVLKFID